MWLYNICMALYEVVIKFVALWHPKARLWSDGRKDIFRRLQEAIPADARVAWVHVASLGEFEQGRPIIEQLRREHPEYKILLTFFSPSGYEIRKNYEGADYIFYLPVDRKSYVRRFLDIAHPELAVFVKYEFWLNMLAELRARKVRTFIVSAIFRRNSIFFKPYGSMWVSALKTFETLFVQDDNSQSLLAELGFSNVVVAGDTRFDRVAQIAAAAKRIEIIERFKGASPLFVAGSTWGPDEEILLPLIKEYPQIKFVIAPHEMNEQRIATILAQTKAVRYTQIDKAAVEEAQVLVLDTVGLLSSVYGYAQWSYIGGGFGVGIHNTLEAATFGLPIAFGPNYEKFKEARDMVALGAARSVESYEELKQWFAPLHDDESHLAATSALSKEYTAKHQGATAAFLRALFG